eukprot:TRINITY_DN1418_c0_g1_i6.p1 TRINITY_DN1418_c0_g1~~TRINITY_DN1418_c0_g1_i6.p1  ORF type:complete len:590 (+),score=119.99 TRINITY_DN1418_c0_g1_i6:75-1844(+)
MSMMTMSHLPSSCVVLFLFSIYALCSASSSVPPPPAQPQLWWYHRTTSSVSNHAEPAFSKGVIDEARAAGYTGMVLADNALSDLNRPDFNTATLKEIVSYAESKGVKVTPTTANYGYSNSIVVFNRTWAEAQQSVGARFKVSGSSLLLQNSLPPLVNGNFENGKTGWFSLNDEGVTLDTDASHCHGGSACAVIEPNPTGKPQRLYQKITVVPYRTYHLRFWVKYTGLNSDIKISGYGTGGIWRLMNQVSRPSATQDWMMVDSTFISFESDTISLYIGLGEHAGTVWVDDISAEEIALMNVMRRDGTPLRIYNPVNNVTYNEGSDVYTISDPLSFPHGQYDIYHTPPVPKLPASTKLTQGEIVAIDYYAVIPSYKDATPACMTEPGVFDYLRTNMIQFTKYFNKSSGIMFTYDEIRHMHSCQRCQSKFPTAGELLAWNTQQVSNIAEGVSPGIQLYVWSDMFDPVENAHDHYYDVPGTIAGSWLGLPDDMIIMNWHLGDGESAALKFFAGMDSTASPPQTRTFQQIIAGYYDSHNGAQSATEEIEAAHGVPGLLGVMYTTWGNDFSQLRSYADATKAAWPAYVKSVVTDV